MTEQQLNERIDTFCANLREPGNVGATAKRIVKWALSEDLTPVRVNFVSDGSEWVIDLERGQMAVVGRHLAAVLKA